MLLCQHVFKQVMHAGHRVAHRHRAEGVAVIAAAEAQQTAEMFKEIAKQLEALLKEETPQRIAEARQLAAQLAKAEKEFAEKFQAMGIQIPHELFDATKVYEC